METWDTEIPDHNGTWKRQKAFLEWRAAVLKIRDMSETRLRKLYKSNYTPADIAADKHWEQFPPQGMKKRVAPGMALGEKRGRALTAAGRQLAYAKALLARAEWLLQFRRLEPDMLAIVRADVETYKKLVATFKVKY